MELTELKTTIKEKFFTGGFISGPDLRGLDSEQRKKADDLLARAKAMEASGMTDGAQRLRHQVDTMVKKANSGADLPASKREKINSRKAMMRTIKYAK